jgi:hypothetical protein
MSNEKTDLWTAADFSGRPHKLPVRSWLFLRSSPPGPWPASRAPWRSSPTRPPPSLAGIEGAPTGCWYSWCGLARVPRTPAAWRPGPKWAKTTGTEKEKEKTTKKTAKKTAKKKTAKKKTAAKKEKIADSLSEAIDLFSN